MTDIDGLCWWKSTRSGNQGGNCIEVAASGDAWYVRDSKDPAAGHLTVGVASWRSFVAMVKDDAR
ncbi:hypothetical protein Athai_22820 [Actinocatenispora thailandica]|uniref:DUF397 domain-containing protein n=1 Tax=Actinocatenispora thailandica TaxID=227318 RepID=A0A7R7DN32_9ACTN|nr:DUF397 domain-containing protein [Actinocatenispora thailandica]BCJ34779.1 hypothetical protein Athai_22820 [Actinocatenispora thailandica]